MRPIAPLYVKSVMRLHSKRRAPRCVVADFVADLDVVADTVPLESAAYLEATCASCRTTAVHIAYMGRSRGPRVQRKDTVTR